MKGVTPTHAKRGHGCWLWDHDGKKYLDFVGGHGTNILGYANAQVNAAIAAQAEMGACLSLSTHVELDAAEAVKSFFPFVDALKFMKSGTDARNAAIKIARAATGRPAVLLGPDIGQVKADTAAVIVEPVITDYSRERIEWLKELRGICTKRGALLIFDETETGFRFPKYSVASWCGVTPDLIILGKAIANGMPLAAVGGKFAVMNSGECFVGSSYAGETLTLAACKKTIELLHKKYDVNLLWKKGQAFLDEFNAIYPEKIRVTGYPTRAVFEGDPLVKALFWQEASLAGMLFGPVVYFNFPLAEEAKNAMGAIAAILGRIKRGEVPLKGEMPKEVR